MHLYGMHWERHSGAVKHSGHSVLLNQCIYSCHGLKEAMSRKASRRRQININVVCTITCRLSLIVRVDVVLQRTVVVYSDYVHLDDQTPPTFEMTPGFKPFTITCVSLSWSHSSQYSSNFKSQMHWQPHSLTKV